MDYYVYVSDSKVDMLLPQIRRARDRKVSREMSAHVGPVSAKQTSETRPLEDRIHRLRVVVDHLRSKEQLGTIDLPGPWIEDELDLQWGMLNHFHMAAGEQVAWFSGYRDGVYLGMGGSASHLIGYGTADGGFRAGSLAPTLLAALSEEVALVLDEDEADRIEGRNRLAAVPELARDLEDETLRGIAGVAASHHFPAQRMRFVAKRLLWGPTWTPDADGRAVEATAVLGTPLFVAQVD